MKMKDKVAIVTGAGRGIGKAIALSYAREGADIIAVSRTPSEVKETASQIKALGRHALPLKVDVSRREDVENTVKSALEEFGKIDVLVNNAGILGPIGPLVENDANHWIETIKVNLIGTFLCCKAVLPVMIKQGEGKIINLSGGGAAYPKPRFSAYGASKAAVVRLTETLAEEVKHFNIQVNAIAPGAINTRIQKEILAAGEVAGEKASAEAEKVRETGGTPSNVPAALAVFLASDESGMLTGKLISAVWDDWQNMGKHVSQIISTDLYTLRRVTK